MPFPLSEGDMAAAEAACGARFPDSYRQKMLRDNGGEVEAAADDFQLFTVLDRSDSNRLARTSGRELVGENRSALEWPGFPRDAVAIADNGAGDYLVFMREGDVLQSRVLLWDHETHELEAVAQDFAELLDSEQ